MDIATISGTPRSGELKNILPPMSRLIITSSTNTHAVPMLFMTEMTASKENRSGGLSATPGSFVSFLIAIPCSFIPCPNPE